MHRQRQGDGLAVNADRNLLRVAGHRDGLRGQHPYPVGVPATEQADRLPGAAHPDGHHAEHTAVEPRAAAQPRDVSGLIRIAAHQQRLRPVDRLVAGDRVKPGAALPLQQVRQRVQGGAQLVVPVGRCLHDLSVGPE